MDDIIKIAKELGIPGVLLLMVAWFTPKIGMAIYEGISWFGVQFLIPIRDGIIGNISILTAFITEMRTAFPLLTQSQKTMAESMEKSEERHEKTQHDAERTKQMLRAVAMVLSRKCPEKHCPLIKVAADSDLHPVGGGE